MRCVLHILVACGLVASFSDSALAGEPKPNEPRVKLEIRLAESQPAEGLEEFIAPQTEEKIYVHKQPSLTNADIESAKAVTNSVGQPAIAVRFVESSHEKVARFSGDNIDKFGAIFIDGKLVSAPRIRSKFVSTAEITGNFTRGETERIVQGLAGK